MPIFEVHIHRDGVDRAVLERLDAIHAQGERLMATVKALQDVIDKIDMETNDIARKIDAEAATIAALKAQIANGSGVSDADLDPILSNLNTLSQRLGGLAADTSSPAGDPAAGGTTQAPGPVSEAPSPTAGSSQATEGQGASAPAAAAAAEPGQD